MPKNKRNRNEILLNKNDINEIKITFKDLPYKEHFKFLCKLKPNSQNESIEIIESAEEKNFNIKIKGLVYVFILNKKLIKVGSSITGFKGRVGSYNCGKRYNRMKGTCSTTNYFVLQSFLEINKEVNVYAFFPPRITADVFGEKQIFSLPPKQWEKKILEKMKTDTKMPILCTQR